MATTFSDMLQLESLSKIKYIEVLQKWGLLSLERKCPKCKFDMVLGEKKGMNDGYSWRCNRSGCKVVSSIRRGTWFQNSKLPLQQIILISYMWCLKYSQQIVRHELGVSERTSVDWFYFCRQVTAEIVERNSEPLGGPGKIVQVGEYKVSQQRIFGGVELDGSKSFFVKIDHRDADALVNLIKKYVLPDSTVHSDSWKAYKSLGAKGYKDLTTHHSLTFVCDDVETNKIEDLWGQVKRSLPTCNRKSHLLDSYLAEFMWRRLRSGYPCIFKAFLVDAAEVYHPSY